MSGYTPLFGSIVRSSIWDEDAKTCKVWITLLALSDFDGIVDTSLPGLAHEARVSLEECQKAIGILSNPDKHSSSQDYEGRRITKIDGGWKILNHGKYRQKAKSRAEYMRDYRKRNSNVTHRNTPLHDVTKSSHTNTNTNTNATNNKKNITNITDEFECEFWPNVPNKLGKGKAREAYIQARKKKKVPKETILAGLQEYTKYEAERQVRSKDDYRPLHPATWLNQERWDDEIKTSVSSETPDERIERLKREGLL